MTEEIKRAICGGLFAVIIWVAVRLDGAWVAPVIFAVGFVFFYWPEGEVDIGEKARAGVQSFKRMGACEKAEFIPDATEEQIQEMYKDPKLKQFLNGIMGIKK